MNILPIDIKSKFSLITEYYSPKQIATINDMAIKIAKFKGPFTWHTHENSDELFWVVKGTLTIEIRNASPLIVQKNCLTTIPKGLEHRPNCPKETWVALLEPADLLNTGNIVNSFTRKNIDKI